MKALILVDYENEWITPDSDYYVGDISEVIKQTNDLLDFCRAQQYKIVFIRHIEKDSELFFAENTERTAIIKTLHKQKEDVVVDKYKISPFYKTSLELELDGISELVISGILSNLCVRSLIQDAYDREYKITVIKDCCAAFETKTQEFTFQDLKNTRAEIDFVTLQGFIQLSN